MCTAITYQNQSCYFGRTLDLEYRYREQVTITPRRYPFHFQQLPPMDRHYAMIGMAYIQKDYPLYYDATNEMGLSIAGLNFPGNAHYFSQDCDWKGSCLAVHELIPWVLGQCASLEEVRQLLSNVRLMDWPFQPDLPPATLHWIAAHGSEAITIEPLPGGLKLYDNPIGVLTNNPPFDSQLYLLDNYMNLTSQKPENRFCPKLQLRAYSHGMGAMGLPGDLSSTSRFVRAAFTKLNSICGPSEEESVSQVFHILGSVQVSRGCVDLGDEQYDVTQYTSCCNADKGIYYYTSYANRQITAVDMHREPLEDRQLICYPMIEKQQIFLQNA